MLGEFFILSGSGEHKPLKRIKAPSAGVIVDEEAMSAELALDLKRLKLCSKAVFASPRNSSSLSFVAM
jgi:hypothetical protein